MRITFFKKYVGMLKYNTPLKTAIVSYVRIALALIINMKSVKESIDYIRNCNNSIILLIVITVYPFVLSIFFQIQRNIIRRAKGLDLPYSTLLPVKLTIYSINFYPIFLLKRLLFCFIIVFLDEHLVWQVVLIIILSIIYVVYLHKVSPLSSIVSQRGFLIAEIGFILCFFATYLTGGIQHTSSVKIIYGWITIGIIVITIVACWLNFLIVAIPDIIKGIKAKCNKCKPK